MNRVTITIIWCAVHVLMLLFTFVGVCAFFALACRSLEEHPLASIACLGMCGVFFVLGLAVCESIAKLVNSNKQDYDGKL